MLVDRMYYFQRGRIRYNLLIRAWRPSRWLPNLAWFLRNLWCPISKWHQRYEFSLQHRSRNSWRCYCPSGSSSDLRLALFGWGLWISLGRDWTALPCLCDRVSWAVLPDLYAEEIEDYGADRLRAEFPDLWREHEQKEGAGA